MDNPIIPVLLGADLNCYNVARAFHMRYGVRSYAFGRYEISATKYSSIINFTKIPDIDDDEVMLKTLNSFSMEHKGNKLVLFGCTDDYAAMIIRHKSELSDYVIPYPSEEILNTVSKKAEFYEACERYGIPYPSTVIIDSAKDSSELEENSLGFGYPIIIKPSSSVIYWKHPFDGMKKVYTAENSKEASEIIRTIYSNGYDDRIVLQEMIAGNDTHMRVLTTFSDEKGKVRAMCLGHTLLEEHTPKGLGNHAAIITEPIENLSIAEKIRTMLEDIGYTGFGNFDIKLRKGTKDDFRVFEINLRQGRSNFYLTSASVNVAQLAVECYSSVYEGGMLTGEHVFWHHIPKSVVYEYTEDEELVKEAKRLTKEGKEFSSLWYPKDFKNPLRLVCVLEVLRRQNEKYKKYYIKGRD